MSNPFQSEDRDRYALWEMLVQRDIEAFISQDWAQVADDFLDDGFSALDAHASANPDDWTLRFSSLAAYRESWLKQAATLNARVSAGTLRQALFEASRLTEIDIDGAAALARKKFDGALVAEDGEVIPLHWQTLYQCVRQAGRWKIAGFVGYLPYAGGREGRTSPRKHRPASSQHKTAGPYSPVLVVSPGDLVVISGQAAIDPEGNVVGTTLDEQARATLENCRQQLVAAGCDFADVFKANVYLTDLGAWSAFNEVYRAVMPEPRPVRTAVQAGLLPGLLVEVEMWAVKP